MMPTLYLPTDSLARAVGADEVAVALITQAQETGGQLIHFTSALITSLFSKPAHDFNQRRGQRLWQCSSRLNG